MVPECSAGKAALVQGRSRPGFMQPFWDKWDKDNWDNKRFQHALAVIHTSFIYNNINILLNMYSERQRQGGVLSILLIVPCPIVPFVPFFLLKLKNRHSNGGFSRFLFFQ